MNFTSIIQKQICLLKPGELFIARNLYKEKLSYIPEFTFYKVLERMVKNNKIARIAKGIYSIPVISRFGASKVDEKEIIKYYTGKEKQKGLLIGYSLYNKYGISTQISKNIEIYSNLMEGQKKSIQNITIKKVNIKLTESIIQAIEALEILQNYGKIEDASAAKLLEFIQKFTVKYDDITMNRILHSINYKKRTIAFLEMILKHYEIYNTLNKYLHKTSLYKIPTMEEIHELAQ
ncbi:MAG: DUF6088 family protein [Saccharofermentanales bacterium]